MGGDTTGNSPTRPVPNANTPPRMTEVTVLVVDQVRRNKSD